ncbi:MAG: DUF5684 domain-containing protein [Actinomycetota bacterium]|jgi:magnesium-transporting ATPase (P-type)|nr:DUF5684 domain-containing protein [Actinomycetota bacterium]MDD5600809.1 DUF5684 domain-containing protein [Actinomycetota bacterium]
MTNIETAFATMAVGLTFFLIFLSSALSILLIVSLWKIFTKAGKPGWASIVPIYNTIVMLEIAGKPIWWIILLFIPVVNLVISIIVIVELANKFGKSGGFAAGLIFLPVIFYPILAFSSAKYTG